MNDFHPLIVCLIRGLGGVYNLVRRESNEGVVFAEGQIQELISLRDKIAELITIQEGRPR